MTRHALISGASVGGPALAHELNARGWRTTVVERYPRLRDEGQNIDVRGAGREVLRRMGLEAEALVTSTTEVGTRFVDDRGGTVGEFPAGEDDIHGPTAELEILRGEMARILFEHTVDDTDYRFGEQIADLTDADDHVTATLASGERIDADLVVVAEGTRSRTRSLVVPDAELSELGLIIANITIPRTADDDRWWRWMHTTRTRGVSLRPDNVGTTRAMLSFLTDVRGLEQLDHDDQVMILRKTFADVGWEAPRILEVLDDAPMYVDAVAQVKLDRWSSGRRVLLGDAAWATGPFGTGTTLALTGAHVLAGELDRNADHQVALQRYEEVMRPFVTEAQNVNPRMIRAVNPGSRAALVAQQGVLRTVATLQRWTGLADRIFSPPADKVELPEYALRAREQKVGL
ncbi:FAD-dependent monooxygenase [Actinomycetospora corticicola]|uniref:2-polyprenyl-6-methoxyphenol hydroxylase-like FAD-dependent oxidoreductase n=1 Tax=Actinomycetospora corticicola TaxID=663602 RepID=A0A7Y9J488_9PSEU|nr:FAD-dependent monooxygenase [Actinomycetospora corticicola]NYD34434.1 2-polyprenyl-6-methoxyphenol hydroxylase-like FAD-dependent oxidoreductase [Actinomycetospora corticicola]